jgi:hypothetical protein
MTGTSKAPAPSHALTSTQHSLVRVASTLYTYVNACFFAPELGSWGHSEQHRLAIYQFTKPSGLEQTWRSKSTEY